MRYLVRVLALAALAGGCVEPSSFEKMSRLERDVRFAAIREAGTTALSLWLAQADGRELLAIDADRPVAAASTLKILILVEAHAQAIDGTFRFSDEHSLQDGEIVEGTGSFQNERVGSSWTYLQYAKRMISESDNTAANILLRRLGMRNVNERAAKLGLEVTHFEREFMDFAARDHEHRENWTTARELGQLMRRIFRREILTREACDEMIRLLEHTTRGRIAAGVPKEIAVGHKSGSMPGVRHDVGWVRVPGHPYILSVCLDRVLEDRSGEEDRGVSGLEAIGRIVYDAVGPTDE
jgi:beta-lactamase class A